ncbi:MAG: ABC transporter ATP-binding protein/permease [Coriobacteriaceae bacterium]|nr:ABC transporter ATP-binding protein/permease [Coriobacteriaceae bacterium]
MLQLTDIRKSYTTGDFTQVALDGVTISFRDNEFAAILGPSGSGKTTLLNVIGGLDHYDAGDLTIDGVSTRDYKDRDWDTYRNNRIGFVFQSYNLIPHQSVLANVELALTLSGVGLEERRRRAQRELERVGLAEHAHKRPSQLSGGQMQRVAIARALINDPEILLADEPTGALDSKTSVQIMDLLSEIAKDRLVIMVTHNPELAERYATRTVSFADGHVVADSHPFDPDESDRTREREKKIRSSSMSFLTALSLSFNNLMTKKGRTIMTAFAGSIGIIGIAAILALANGVNAYVASVEEETLSSYPLQIMSTGFDLTSLMASGAGGGLGGAASGDDGEVKDGEVRERSVVNQMFEGVGTNDLAALKTFLDGDESNIDAFASDVAYRYNVTPRIYLADTRSGVQQVNPDTTLSAYGYGGNAGGPMMSDMMKSDIFSELPGNLDTVKAGYDVKAGHWPKNRNEVVLVLSSDGGVSDLMLYTLGLRDRTKLDEMTRAYMNGEEITVDEDDATFTYDDFMDLKLKLVPSSNLYQRDDEFGVWVDKSNDDAYVAQQIAVGEDLVVSGIVQAREGSKSTALSSGVYYTPELTEHLIEVAAGSQVVKDQLASPETDVFTGKSFADEGKGSTDFDMANLFSIDTGAIEAAFTFDPGKLQLDLDDLSFDLDSSSLPQPDLDLGQLLQSPDGGTPNLSQGLEEIKINQEVAAAMGDELMQGFRDAVAAGEVEPSDEPGAMVEQYLASDAAQQIIASAMRRGLVDLSAVEQAQQEQVKAIQDRLNTALASYMTEVVDAVSSQLETAMTEAMTRATAQLSEGMSEAVSIDADAFKDAFKMNMTDEELTSLVTSMMGSTPSSLDGNLAKLDYADMSKPYTIDIYARDFESKQGIIDVLDGYNERMSAAGDEAKVITYTDIVGALMSSVTTIVDMISYVLIAFVSISLVVSSIMIGIITYISVLERRKEIGILRAIGASKGNVSQIFNAETIIEGLISGVFGVGITVLTTFPVNAVVNSLFDVPNVAILPWQTGVVLIAISVGLSFIAGLIPARSASRKDPVEALRSE